MLTAVEQELYDELDERFADGRAFVCGDAFTVADITLASLGALTTFPQGYTGLCLANTECSKRIHRNKAEGGKQNLEQRANTHFSLDSFTHTDTLTH